MTDQEKSPDGPVGHTPHDNVPQMSVSVAFKAATPQGAGTGKVAQVSMQDSNHPGIRALLQYLVPDDLATRLDLVAFSVEYPMADRPVGAARFGPGVIKDLPLARWDRVAQAAVTNAAMERSIAEVSVPLRPFRLEPDRYEPGQYNAEQAQGEVEPERDDLDAADEVIATPLHVPRDRRERAIEMVRRVRPDLNPDESRGAARSWNGLVKLAEALDEYMEILASGSKDPAGEMAERHGVAQATVRTWVHRARQAGLTSTFSGWTPSGGTLPPRPPKERRISKIVEEVFPEPSSLRNLNPYQQIGQSLAEARLGSGMTVEDVTKATRVREGLVRSIEIGEFRPVGGDVYARGHIRAIARAVGADARQLVAEYDAARRAEKEEGKK
ncbi:helix-turn-helix domain-containing protein [Streptomyces ipomoeae]|uniref:helix-turn-helix domain-containing protein n=1 Tax=Streptomyces ipomoeae TaxID=103232 RepID=UPI0029B65F47|nr:helix-turn-helix transcriptional regulator [Streptomyces ipomoeae]MDX2696840.1 helix-turn-helix transcriptional regulator [Streptomyces ipomoeae]MDX2843170.1 helix-turn-helix transcriptional regulator [Streptomyces ipomoeae]